MRDQPEPTDQDLLAAGYVLLDQKLNDPVLEKRRQVREMLLATDDIRAAIARLITCCNKSDGKPLPMQPVVLSLKTHINEIMDEVRTIDYCGCGEGQLKGL